MQLDPESPNLLQNLTNTTLFPPQGQRRESLDHVTVQHIFADLKKEGLDQRLASRRQRSSVADPTATNNILFNSSYINQLPVPSFSKQRTLDVSPNSPSNKSDNIGKGLAQSTVAKWN